VDYLKISELLALGRSPHTNSWGHLSESDHKVIQEIGDILKLNNLTNCFYSELSDGQKQKALLARALIQKPRFLFLDEPTTYLDIPTKIELMKSLKMLSRDKKIGIVFSTHDLNLVEDIVDSIWLIDTDGILHQKSPDQMKESGLLYKNFNI
jgi:iron complex transport system ATP-binding protein